MELDWRRRRKEQTLRARGDLPQKPQEVVRIRWPERRIRAQIPPAGAVRLVEDHALEPHVRQQVGGFRSTRDQAGRDDSDAPGTAANRLGSGAGMLYTALVEPLLAVPDR